MAKGEIFFFGKGKNVRICSQIGTAHCPCFVSLESNTLFVSRNSLPNARLSKSPPLSDHVSGWIWCAFISRESVSTDVIPTGPPESQPISAYTSGRAGSPFLAWESVSTDVPSAGTLPSVPNVEPKIPSTTHEFAGTPAALAASTGTSLGTSTLTAPLWV
jgi:hypothetical protein